MKTTDVRNETFEGLRGKLPELRRLAYEAWVRLGPGTTRLVAALSGMDILTFRPRTTELVGCGLVVCCGQAGHEGIYRAATELEWNWRRDAMVSKQLVLL